MDNLTENTVYRFGVEHVQLNFDRFVKQPSGQTSYCHLLTLSPLNIENGELISGQFCSDYEELRDFGTGDIVQLKALKYSDAKKMRSFRFMERIKIGGWRDIKSKLTAGEKTNTVLVEKEVANFKPYFNPNVTGSARERALGHACHLFQMQGKVDPSDVLEAAKIFEAFLLGDQSGVLNQ